MKRKKVIPIIVAVVVVAALGGAGVLYSQGFFGKGGKAASTTSYQVVKLTTGDLEQSVTGTGTLAAGGSVVETVTQDMEIDEVLVSAGQSVKAGDTLATIDQESLSDQVAALQEEIDAIDTSLASMIASQSSASTLTTTVSGRVKKILCQQGDSAKDVTEKSGGLFLLSTDGKMKLTCKISKASALAIGDTVRIKTNGNTYKGLVEALSSDGKTVTATLTDNGPKLEATALLYDTGWNKLGSGTLQINRPYYVAAASGSIGDVYVSLNQKVGSRTKLAYLVGIPLSEDYDDQVTARADKAETLSAIKKLIEAGKLVASEDGTVQSVTVADGQTLKAGDTVATILTGGAVSLEVAVDELDINSILVGQKARITMDAFADKRFEGTVESISQIGSSSNGVTTYKVAITLDAADSALKVGMNATATIVIEKHEGVLLLPMEALNSSRGEQYVWMYTGALPENSTQDPGKRTVVKTGMSSGNYVEITDGLTAEDQVVVVRTRSAGSSGSQQQGGMMFPGMEGGGMPGQGQWPSGGQRPSGGMPGGRMPSGN